MSPQSTPYQLPFLKKEQVAKDTYSFYFDRSSLSTDFTAGQYIRMILPHENSDDRGDRRYFTIASSPLQKDIQMHTTKIIEKRSSLKNHLFQLQPGEIVNFFGPMGNFVLPETDERPVVFLAGGIGITPFHSMILYANAIKRQVPITLFVSFSTVEEVIFFEELQNVAAENSLLKPIYTVTHLEDPEQSLRAEESQVSWGGETGRISSEMIKKYVSDIMKPVYYLSGPPAMVEAMKAIVSEMQIPPEQIKEEKFTGY